MAHTTKHPQNSGRGLLGKKAIGFDSTGLFALHYSHGTAVMVSDSTGVIDFVGNISIGGSGEDIAHDSTGMDLPGTLTLGGQAGKDISQNSTSFFIPGSFSFLSAVGSTAVLLAANSTGFTIAVGTGTAAQIATG